MGKLDLKKITAEAHAMAVSKGWWAGQTDVDEKLLMIASEVFEALDCYRCGDDLSLILHRNDASLPVKPLGFGIELADAVIRICDLAGYLEIDLEKAAVGFFYLPKWKDRTTTELFKLTKLIIQAQDDHALFLSAAVRHIIIACDQLSIDLAECIRIKMEYNKTRPYRHGGKRC